MHSVYQVFCHTAERFGEHPFLHLVPDTAERYGIAPGAMSYAEVAGEVQSLSACYASLDLQPGQRVGLALDNRPEAFTHWFALNALGVSVVPLNPQWRSGELEYVFAHSELVAVVSLPDRIDMMRAAVAAVGGGISTLKVQDVTMLAAGRVIASDDTAAECALLYTSGTTGNPKGCILSNEYFLSTGAWYRDLGGLCALTPGAERLLTPLPMYHMNAMATSTMGMLFTGGCIVPLDRFHPSSFWASVQESEATILHYLGVMPAMLMAMEPASSDRAHSIRFGFGAGLNGELHAQFEERFGFMLVEAWAMTETGCGVAIIASEEPRKVGTACFGRAAAHLDYRLVDANGEDVPRGTTGELLIRYRGDNPRFGFFSGYLKDRAATDAAWSGGYFNTGDLIVEDEDGALHFVDRKKNIIRRSGENIAAVEVEQILLQHPAVRAVGVAAVPDELRGDEVFAGIVTDAPVEQWPEVAEDIVRYCLQRLAYYKAPGYVSRLAALPLTATEKIQRTALKELAASQLGDEHCVDIRTMKSDPKWRSTAAS